MKRPHSIACAAAFATSLASPGAAAPTFTVVDGGTRRFASVSDYFGREYTFYLYANNRKTGLPIARANCSANLHGVVVALSPVPLEAPPDPRLAVAPVHRRPAARPPGARSGWRPARGRRINPP